MDFNPIYEKLFLKSKRNQQEKADKDEFPAPTVMMLGAPTPPQGVFGNTDEQDFPAPTVMMLGAPTPPQGVFGDLVDPRLQRQVGRKDEIPRVYNPMTGQLERQNSY